MAFTLSDIIKIGVKSQLINQEVKRKMIIG